MAHLGGFETLDIAALQAQQIAGLQAQQKAEQENQKVQNIEFAAPKEKKAKAKKTIVQKVLPPPEKLLEAQKNGSPSGSQKAKKSIAQKVLPAPEKVVNAQSVYMSPSSMVPVPSVIPNFLDSRSSSMVPVPSVIPNFLASSGEIAPSPAKKPKTPKPKKEKPQHSEAEAIAKAVEIGRAQSGPKAQNPIIFDESYEALGTWRKVIQARSSGNHVDPYLYTPDNKKLRSGNDLIDYISKNPKYWPVFDPKIINFDRNVSGIAAGKPTGNTKKLEKFLELVNNGVSVQEALDSLQHVVKEYLKKPNKPKNPDGTPKNSFKRKSYGGAEGGPMKIKIGPKSAMKKWKEGESQLNREVVSTLEKYFCANITKPSDGQMLQWSKELSVPFDDVYDWFQKKWKGKIEYEYQKAKQKEEMGNNPDRSRAVKSFEPTTILPDDDEEDFELPFMDVECDVEIEDDNAEEDC